MAFSSPVHLVDSIDTLEAETAGEFHHAQRNYFWGPGPTASLPRPPGGEPLRQGMGFRGESEIPAAPGQTVLAQPAVDGARCWCGPIRRVRWRYGGGPAAEPFPAPPTRR